MRGEPAPRPVRRRSAALAVAVIVVVAGGLVVGLHQLLATTQHVPRPPRAVERLEQPLALVDGECPAPPDTSQPVPVTSTLLLECPRLLRNQTVLYRGEAVRATIEQGRHAWLQVNDGPYALDVGPLPAHRAAAGTNAGIAVRIPRDQAARIDTLGDAAHHGTVIDVTGTWQTSDASDAGGAAIRASAIDVVRPGHRIASSLSPLRTWAAVITGLLAAVLAGAAWWRRP